MPRKIGLCIGINQFADHTRISPLRGCVNDALLIGQMMSHAGFEVRQVHDQAATKSGVVGRLQSVVAQLTPGDHLAVWISSHGFQVRDRSGDELHDGLDEAVCSYDTDVRAPLSDDLLAMVFARANPQAKIFIGCDTCHSGSMTRHSLSELTDHGKNGNGHRTPRLWLPTEDVRFRQGQVDFDMWKLVSGEDARVRRHTTHPKTVRGFGRLGGPRSAVPHVLLTGCKSDQVSWDAHLGGQFHGAMSFNFAKAVLSAWRDGSSITYREAHRLTHEGVRDEFDQDPQLEGPDDLIDQPVFGV